MYSTNQTIPSLTDDSPIEFVLPGNGEEYIDLAHTMLSLRVSLKATSEPAEAVGAQRKMLGLSTISCTLCLIKWMYFSIKNLNHHPNAYAYRAYIEILLNYGPGEKLHI